MVNPALAFKCLKTQNDLVIVARIAHWNVRGPNFYESHLLFGRIYEIASERVDGLVEVLRALGHSPSFQEFSGPDGAPESYVATSLIDMVHDYAMNHYASIVTFNETLASDPMSVGLSNLLEQLAEEVTTILYLLNSAKGK